MFRFILPGFLGLCFGLLTAAGVFTVFSAVSLVPRFVGKTHSAKEILLYEDMIVGGSITGGVFYLLADIVDLQELLVNRCRCPQQVWCVLANSILVLIGLFGGMFVGCLALAIAEMLDSIPIFSRRIAFRHGLGLAVLCMAAGKLCGSLFYFCHIYSG